MDGPRVAAGAATAREPFDLTFRLHADDYQAFLRRARWSAAERMATVLPGLGIGALGAALGAFAAIAAGRGGDPVWFIAAVCVGATILFLVYRFVLMPAYYASLFSGQILAVGETKLVVDARGIAANMGDVVLALPWASVQRVVETDAHV